MYRLALDARRRRSARIAVCGSSLGGYYAARAACYEPRLAAAISHGAIWSVHDMWSTKGDDFGLAMHIRWVFGAKSMHEAHELMKPFTLKGHLEHMRCPYLVMHGGHDVLTVTAARSTYDYAKAHGVNATLRILDPDETGAEHCRRRQSDDRPGSTGRLARRSLWHRPARFAEDISGILCYDPRYQAPHDRPQFTQEAFRHDRPHDPARARRLFRHRRPARAEIARRRAHRRSGPSSISKCGISRAPWRGRCCRADRVSPAARRTQLELARIRHARRRLALHRALRAPWHSRRRSSSTPRVCDDYPRVAHRPAWTPAGNSWATATSRGRSTRTRPARR